jgi:ATP synthase protein I
MEKWRQNGAALKETMRYSTVGLELALAILFGYFAGEALDDWLGTTPWLMLVMVVIGSAAGFLNLFRLARKFSKGDK